MGDKGSGPASKKLKVSLEPLIERKLRYVGADGTQEFLENQTSQERMQELVAKVDFTLDLPPRWRTKRGGIEEGEEEEDNTKKKKNQKEKKNNNKKEEGKGGEEGEGAEEEEEEEEEEDSEMIEGRLLLGVNEKLVHAKSEVDVLCDILNLVSTDKYLKGIQTEIKPKAKQDVNFLFGARRKQLQEIEKGFRLGAKRLKKSVEREQKFFEDLLVLRNYWRLTYSGRNMFVDVSYGTAGSFYGSRLKVDIERNYLSSFESASESSAVQPAASSQSATSMTARDAPTAESEKLVSLDLNVPKEIRTLNSVQLKITDSGSNGDGDGKKLMDSVIMFDHGKLLQKDDDASSSSSKAFINLLYTLRKARTSMFHMDLFNTLTKAGVETSHNKPTLLIENEMQMALDNSATLRFLLSETQFCSASEHFSSRALENMYLSLALSQSLCKMHKEQKKIYHSEKEEIPSLSGPWNIPPVKGNILQDIVDIVQHTLCRQRVASIIEKLSHDIRGIMVMRLHWLQYEHKKCESVVRLILKPPKSVFSWGYVDPKFTGAMQLNICVNRIEMHLSDRRYSNIRECDLVSKIICQVNALLITLLETQAATNNCVVLKGPCARGVDTGGIFEAYYPESNSYVSIELSAASPLEIFKKVTITRKKQFGRMVHGGNEISIRPMNTMQLSGGRKMSVIEMASGSFADDEATVENVEWNDLRGSVLMEKFQTLLLKVMLVT
eukprot:Nk52_evm21s96 gene=Nk52_evmTU21s96